MSQEYQGTPPGDPQDESEIVDETTEETPPQPDGGQPPATPPTPPERTFSQRQVNAFLAEERRKWEASQARRGAGGGGNQPPRETPSPTDDPFDAPTMQGLQRVIDSAIAPYRQAAEQAAINTAISEFKSAHPDVDTKEKLDAVLDVVLELGPEVIQRGDLKKLLNYGYGQWKWSSFDLDSHTRAEVAKALSGKAEKNRTAPNLQGGGGKAPITPARKKDSKPGDFSDANAAMAALVRESEQNQ